MSGKVVLLTGSPSTGKSAILAAILKELQLSTVPVAMMNASEVFFYQLEKEEEGGERMVKKGVTSLFTENLRRSVALKVDKVLVDYTCKITTAEPVKLTELKGNFLKPRRQYCLLEMDPLGKVPPVSANGHYTYAFRATLNDHESNEVTTSILTNAIHFNVSRFGRDLSNPTHFDGTTVKIDTVGAESITLHKLDEGWMIDEVGFVNDEVQLANTRDEVNEHGKFVIDEGEAQLIPGVLFITGLDLPSSGNSTFFVDLVKTLDQLTYPFFAPTFFVVANYHPELTIGLSEVNELYYPLGVSFFVSMFTIITKEYDDEDIEKVYL